MYNIVSSVRTEADVADLNIADEIAQGAAHPYFIRLRSKLQTAVPNTKLSMQLPRVREGSIEFEVIFNLTFETVEALIFAVNLLQGGEYLKKLSNDVIDELYGHNVRGIRTFSSSSASVFVADRDRRPTGVFNWKRNPWAAVIVMSLLIFSFMGYFVYQRSLKEERKRNEDAVLARLQEVVDSIDKLALEKNGETNQTPNVIITFESSESVRPPATAEEPSIRIFD